MIHKIENRDLVVLAGLLHDIDRFWINGKTNFFENFRTCFPKQIPLDGDNGLVALTLNYQSPKSELQGLIRLADTWTSGFDRVKSQTPTSNKKSLVKIFKRLDSLRDKVEHTNSYIPLQELSLSENLLGDSDDSFDETVLKNLNDAFEKEFKLLETEDWDKFMYSFYHLLKKYTWCIPAYNYETDISLFEHSKLTAAIAQSIFDYSKTDETAFKNENNLLSVKGSRTPLQLWCIDISGIQKFIYNISSSFASKSLKGRSFYLQAVLDNLCRYIVQQTQSTICNLVYSSGGKFFLILPNTEEINQKMTDIESHLQQYLWQSTSKNFYICFGSVEWNWNEKTYSAIGANGLDSLWIEATKAAAQQKSQKFKSIVLEASKFTKLFEGNMDEGGEKEICMVTGVEIDKPTVFRKKSLKISDEIVEQIKIGDGLKALISIPQKNIKNIDDIFKVYINDSKSQVINLIPKNEEITLSLNKKITTGFQFYGGSELATEGGKLKTLETLVGIFRKRLDDDESEIDRTKSIGNLNRLGILRMDVDNLGKLFTNGFRSSTASFSSFATLSNSLDWFFSAYLNTIRRKKEYKDWVNIIYSGGDDIFAVGRWDKIIDFSNQIRLDFLHFVGRSDISISAGISIVTPKFPIAKAADMAGSALQKSKDLKRTGLSKNAITLFEIAVGWEEFESIINWKNDLVEWLDKELVSMGLLQKLFRYFNIFKKNPTNQSWKWNAAYNLARQAKGANNDEQKAILNKIKNLLFTEIDKEKTFRFDALIVACRWAELTYRDKLKNDK